MQVLEIWRDWRDEGIGEMEGLEEWESWRGL